MRKERDNKIVRKGYTQLIDSIGTLLESARKQTIRTISNILVKTYWEIGKRIVEYEQKGGEKAEYGTKLLTDLSKDLRLKHRKGFSKSNVYLMQLLYIKYPKFQTLSGKLSWSHYVELLGVSDDLARSFYEKQCIKGNWSVRDLRRQINSMLFERIALSKDKKGVLKLAKKGQMNMYLNYFKAEVKSENDNPPVGIILGAEKDNILVEYALGGISNKLYISRYKLYLPDKKRIRTKTKLFAKWEELMLRLKFDPKLDFQFAASLAAQVCIK